MMLIHHPPTFSELIQKLSQFPLLERRDPPFTRDTLFFRKLRHEDISFSARIVTIPIFI
jgi:hypothetical protein